MTRLVAEPTRRNDIQPCIRSAILSGYPVLRRALQTIHRASRNPGAQWMTARVAQPHLKTTIKTLAILNFEGS